jgi:hypothetical protein
LKIIKLKNINIYKIKEYLFFIVKYNLNLNF